MTPDPECTWSIRPQTINDLVTGLRFEFSVSPTGARKLTVTRVDEGVPGVTNRDLFFDTSDGTHSGSGSGCGPAACGTPIVPEQDTDSADWWKETR